MDIEDKVEDIGKRVIVLETIIPQMQKEHSEMCKDMKEIYKGIGDEVRAIRSVIDRRECPERERLEDLESDVSIIQRDTNKFLGGKAMLVYLIGLILTMIMCSITIYTTFHSNGSGVEHSVEK